MYSVIAVVTSDDVCMPLIRFEELDDEEVQWVLCQPSDGHPQFE